MRCIGDLNACTLTQKVILGSNEVSLPHFELDLWFSQIGTDFKTSCPSAEMSNSWSVLQALPFY